MKRVTNIRRQMQHLTTGDRFCFEEKGHIYKVLTKDEKCISYKRANDSGRVIWIYPGDSEMNCIVIVTKSNAGGDEVAIGVLPLVTAEKRKREDRFIYDIRVDHVPVIERTSFSDFTGCMLVYSKQKAWSVPFWFFSANDDKAPGVEAYKRHYKNRYIIIQF